MRLPLTGGCHMGGRHDSAYSRKPFYLLEPHRYLGAASRPNNNNNEDEEDEDEEDEDEDREPAVRRGRIGYRSGDAAARRQAAAA